MILSSRRVRERLGAANDKDPLVITPSPDLSMAGSTTTASIDLRLGTWFVRKKTRRLSVVGAYSEGGELAEDGLADRYYVPFSNTFIIHPRNFVLAVTLEWIRIPLDLAGMVAGKSSWGRRGLVVETAPGIHPGFSGCLTLEMTNVGEVPVKVQPGTSICQLFLHQVDGKASLAGSSRFFGQRYPGLGSI